MQDGNDITALLSRVGASGAPYENFTPAAMPSERVAKAWKLLAAVASSRREGMEGALAPDASHYSEGVPVSAASVSALTAPVAPIPVAPIPVAPIPVSQNHQVPPYAVADQPVAMPLPTAAPNILQAASLPQNGGPFAAASEVRRANVGLTPAPVTPISPPVRASVADPLRGAQAPAVPMPVERKSVKQDPVQQAILLQQAALARAPAAQAPVTQPMPGVQVPAAPPPAAAKPFGRLFHKPSPSAPAAAPSGPADGGTDLASLFQRLK